MGLVEGITVFIIWKQNTFQTILSLDRYKQNTIYRHHGNYPPDHDIAQRPYGRPLAADRTLRKEDVGVKVHQGDADDKVKLIGDVIFFVVVRFLDVVDVAAKEDAQHTAHKKDGLIPWTTTRTVFTVFTVLWFLRGRSHWVCPRCQRGITNIRQGNGCEYVREVIGNDRVERVVERRRREVAHRHRNIDGGARICMDVVVNR